MSLFEERYDYPDKSIRPFVTLSGLKPSTYVDTVARVLSYKVNERRDQLGTKMVFTGLLEDNTYRVPFISHKASIPIESNVVLKIISAYVHEFQDKSLLSMLTEYTKVDHQQIEDIRDYIWQPKIAHINRPVWNLTLKGIVSTIYNNSGLVKRCNKLLGREVKVHGQVLQLGDCFFPQQALQVG